jgi:hypothetical protein
MASAAAKKRKKSAATTSAQSSQHPDAGTARGDSSEDDRNAARNAPQTPFALPQGPRSTPTPAAEQHIEPVPQQPPGPTGEFTGALHVDGAPSSTLIDAAVQKDIAFLVANCGKWKFFSEKVAVRNACLLAHVR